MTPNLFSCGEHSLPAELVLLVIEHLEDDFQTLGSLAVTCKALQHLAEEQLYKRLEIDTVNDLDKIIGAFKARPNRVRAIQTLRLQYQYKPEHLNDSITGRVVFNQFVQSMVSLREWYIESPYDNFHWNDGTGGHEWVVGDMERFREALENSCVAGPEESERILAERRLGNNLDRTVGLAQLQHLTIHSHGPHTDFWEFGGFHCLFRHPALRYLHVSCVELPEAIPQLDAFPGKTPLTTLIFDECVILPGSLKSILRLPTRLEHLTLGENVFNVRRSKSVAPYLTMGPKMTFEALAQVSQSLISLTHYDPGWKIDFEPHRPRRMNLSGDGLRNFHALKHIQCETSSFIFRAALLNHDFAPPNLESLTLCRHWDLAVNYFESLPELDPFVTLPSLEELRLRQSTYFWNDTASAEYICDEELLRSRHAFAYRLSKSGINLKLLIELHRSPGLIPPYLHGESLPIVRCLYDATEVGFRRHDPASPDAVPYLIPTNTDSSEIQSGPTTIQEPPETDQLYEDDIKVIKGKVRRTLEQIKHRFIRRRRSRTPSVGLGPGSWVSDDSTDMDTDSFFDGEDELDMELDELDMIQDEDGTLYIQVAHETDEDEDEDDDDSNWEDAPEEQETHPDLD